MLPLASCCLSSSEVEVHEEEPHFLLTVLGILQLSKYLGRFRVIDREIRSEENNYKRAHFTGSRVMKRFL